MAAGIPNDVILFITRNFVVYFSPLREILFYILFVFVGQIAALRFNLSVGVNENTMPKQRAKSYFFVKITLNNLTINILIVSKYYYKAV